MNSGKFPGTTLIQKMVPELVRGQSSLTDWPAVTVFESILLFVHPVKKRYKQQKIKMGLVSTKWHSKELILVIY